MSVLVHLRCKEERSSLKRSSSSMPSLRHLEELVPLRRHCFICSPSLQPRCSKAILSSCPVFQGRILSSSYLHLCHEVDPLINAEYQDLMQNYKMAMPLYLYAISAERRWESWVGFGNRLHRCGRYFERGNAAWKELEKNVELRWGASRYDIRIGGGGGSRKSGHSKRGCVKSIA